MKKNLLKILAYCKSSQESGNRIFYFSTWSKLAGHVLGSLPAGLYLPVSTLAIAWPAVYDNKLL